MGQEGLEIVRLWIGGESLWSSEGDEGVAGVEIDIRVQDLPQFRGDRPGADLDANSVRNDYARERKHAGSEAHIGLIEADRIYPVGAAGVLSGDARER